MRNPWVIWAGTAFCLVTVLGATGWITILAIQRDQIDAEQQRQAELEENIRLALWRMESVLIPVIGQEKTRPFAHFTTYYPIAGACNQTYDVLVDGQVFGPSPLVSFQSPVIKLHFQQSPKGNLTSPQVPESQMLSVLEGCYGSWVQPRTAQQDLSRLKSILGEISLAQLVPKVKPGDLVQENKIPILMCAPSLANQQRPSDSSSQNSYAADGKKIGRERNSLDQQLLRSKTEWVLRKKRNEDVCMVLSQANSMIPLQTVAPASELPADPRVQLPKWQNLVVGDYGMFWCQNELMLARAAYTNDLCFVQGAWFDWSKVKELCLDEILDLLPDARLAPARNWSPNAANPEIRALASAPILLIPGELPPSTAGLASPIRNSLAIAWCCVLLAVSVGSVFLIGLLSLNERRAAFVSAVTHELRTPLTTLQMYSQMLSQGMVSDSATQSSYLSTLHRESNRLGHLVENVLAYAKLERGNRANCIQSMTLEELITASKERMETRAGQCGVSLAIQIGDGATVVNTDPTAVGQILFNLIDNACKYAAVDQPRVSLTTSKTDEGVAIRIEDNGPGMHDDARRRLFQPFAKSVSAAAHSAPGVGLGLALSRRLARNLGGDLQFENTDQGCSFVLKLPH